MFSMVRNFATRVARQGRKKPDKRPKFAKKVKLKTMPGEYFNNLVLIFVIC